MTTVPTRREKPKSAKHGIRLQMVDPCNQTQLETQRQVPNTTTAMESDFDLEERMQCNNSRPKSAKFKSRRTENASVLEDENNLFGSRPKSAKHGRRARNAQQDNSNHSNQNGSHDSHDGYQRNQDQRVERVHILEGVSAAEDMQTPRPLYRPKSAGMRQRGRDQHIGSNGEYFLSAFYIHACFKD